MQDVVIVIPVYRKAQALRWFERLSLRRCFDVFGGVYPIVFVAPEGFAVDFMWLAYFLRRWRDRDEEHPRSDLPRAAYAEELRTALAREDVYAAGEAICFAEQHLLPPGDADTAVLVQHVDALLYHGIQDLQDGRPGAAIAYLKAWQRITYKFGGQTWPELYDYLAAAYRAKGMERMAAHVAAMRP